MACCHEEYAYAEECEILVCVDAPDLHNPDLYRRLRFGLLASSWLPSPLGILLWRALHVMLLIVSGPIYWVLSLLTAFLFYSVYVFVPTVICGIVFNAAFGLIAVAADLVLLLVASIRFCWSLVGFLAYHKPILEWRGGACLTVELWKRFKAAMRNVFWAFVPIGVPCVRGSLYKETKDWKLITWARWCDEVVHTHEAIVI